MQKPLSITHQITINGAPVEIVLPDLLNDFLAVSMDVNPFSAGVLDKFREVAS